MSIVSFDKVGVVFNANSSNGMPNEASSSGTKSDVGMRDTYLETIPPSFCGCYDLHSFMEY